MQDINYKMLREFWGVNATTMSKICGFGINQWREYEKGKSMPNKSNSLMIMLVQSPYTFRTLLKQVPQFEQELMGKRYDKLVARANQACSLIDKQVEDYKQKLASEWIK